MSDQPLSNSSKPEQYKNILVALDIFAEHEAVLARGLQMAGNPENVAIMHVVLPEIVYAPYGVTYPTDIVEEANKRAKEKMLELAQANDIPAEKVFTPVGKPADEIHSLAEELDADLIVIGTHGRSGIGLLLGSTANAVLHGVKRDVLSVRV